VNRIIARALLYGAAALTAAAVTDPLLEALSNRGTFGPGRFTDGSNADVLPALALGLLFVMAWIAARIKPALVGDIDLRFSLALPGVLALQIPCLFAMESLEQLAVYGHLLGGTIWLGAPVLAALIGHLIGCVVFTTLVVSVARGCLRRIVDAFRIAIEYLRRIRCADVALLRRTSARAPRHIFQPALSVLRGRAPPQRPVSLNPF
jgi:hypothetical protein